MNIMGINLLPGGGVVPEFRLWLQDFEYAKKTILGSVNCISPLGVAKADTLAVNGSIKKGAGNVCSVFPARRVSPPGSRRTRSGASKPWWKVTAPKPSGPGS